jgi:chromosome segregation protein
MEKNKEEILKNNQEITQIVNEIAQKDENFDLINSEIEKLGEEKHVSITKEIERLKGEIRTIEQGLTFLENQKENKEAEKLEKEQELKENKTGVETASGKIEALHSEKQELQTAIHQLKEEYQEQVSVLSETGLQNLEKISKELDQKKNSFFSLEAQINVLENEIAKSKEDNNELETELQDLYTEDDVLKKEISELEQVLTETEDNITQTNTEYTALKEERETIKQEIDEIETNFLKKRSESIKLHSKLQALKEEQRSSFYKAVNTILKAQDKFPGVYGTISQLGETETKYQTALEVAAGSRIHNVVVDSTETAKACIQYLKDVKAGRATFLPLDRMRRRSYPDIKQEGVIDYAVNLVRFNPEFRPAFEDVFSDTLVVEDMDINLKGKRLVTLEGDIFERGGAITGGHYFKRKYSSAFTISEDKDTFKKVQKELDYLKNRKNELGDRLRIIEPEMQELYDRNLTLKERLPSLKKEMERLKKEKEEFLTDIKEKKSKKGVITQKIQENQNELELCTKNITKLESDIATLEAEKEEISKPLKQDELERIETEIESLREKLGIIDSDIVQTESKQEYLQNDIKNIEKTITKIVPDIAELVEKIAVKEQEKAEFDQSLEGKLEEEEGFDEKIRNLRKQRDEIREDMSKLREKKEVLQRKVYQVESSLQVLENQKEQLQKEIDELRDLSSQYPVEGEYQDLKELKFKIKKMEREKELLEPINMRAVEEFDEVQLRYIELKTRIDKLYEERQSILDFIEEVESQKKSVFFETYYNVAENFSKIFAELSPGGSGSLSLENEEDPFEGGLEIEASPQGKELKRVEAMSGGEKALTALAFVFAVQQYKPAPFYFFDEIDAHLDDENATRVAEMIKRASKDTQFIVITLRDVMMAAADVLYGVSMKEQVSKIVSVELEKIAEYTEPQEDELMVM